MNIAPDKDIVRVVNNEEDAFTISWDSKDYVLRPGKDVFVPAACAFVWFGDPRSAGSYQSLKGDSGVTFFVSDRATEVRRLRILWGAGIAGDEANFDGVVIPDVDVFTIEGEPVTTVLDDPAGDSIMPALVTVGGDADLREQVAKQQRLIQKLMLEQGIEDDEEVNEEGDLPEDGGELVTSGGKSGK